jgi:PhnB protein
MAGKVKPIPEGYHSVTPYLSVNGAAAAIDFYKKAFGAKELFRMGGPEGKIGHAEIQIGDSRVMLADEHPEMNFRSPKSIGGCPVHLYIYVEDVDATFATAVGAGATVKRPLKNEFYGDRSASLEDPFGHCWGIATHIEDLSAEEIEKRAAEAMSKQPQPA